MPVTRLPRFIKSQPVRDAGRPADRSGRKRILLGVRSERRAVCRHQPDRIRNRASRVPVIRSSIAACHAAGCWPSAKTLAFKVTGRFAGVLPVCCSHRYPVASKQNVILADDGMQWHKSVELMDNIYLCHRPISYGAEFAVVEHFPAHGTNEILNRGWNTTEVLKAFTLRQRQALQVWTEDLTAQVKEFLAEKFPGHDLSRVADAFIHKCTTQAVSQKHSPTHGHEQNHSHGMKI
jgi:hypothetical protein